MALNDQADADSLETGLDEDANLSAGQDDSLAQGKEDQTGEEDISDIDAYQAAIDAMEAEQPQGDEGDEGEADSGDEGEGDPAQADGEDEGTEGDPANADGDEGSEDQGEGDEGDDSGEDDDADDKKPTSKRYRVRSEDPYELRVFELKSRNPDMTLNEAMARAKTELGISDEATGDGGDGDQDTGEAALLPSTVEDAEARIATLRAEHKTAVRDDLDFDKADELEEEIEKLRSHVVDLRISEIEGRSQSQTQYLSQLNESKAKAVDLYAFVTQESGAEIERMEEIDRQLKENGDPLYESADKPLRIAQMVAKEFGIPPKGKVVKQPAQPAGGKPPRQKSPVQPASASARTVPTDHAGQLEKRLAEVNDPLAWEELMAEMQ